MPRTPGFYRLTTALVASHAGGPVVCLADEAIGRTFRLHASRPRYDRERDIVRRADVIGPDGVPVEPEPAVQPPLARVTISGPLMSDAGFVAGEGLCGGGWVDGYGGAGGVTDRMVRALADGDVLVVAKSPGGAVIGLPECVDAILAAKAQHQRRVTVIVTGMCASAMYWIASAIADPGEFYVTRASMAGSIGARAAHVNESGALAQAGLEVTDFAYPAGKIALSPNRALTEVGAARGNRDVMIAFEAFAAAVGAARPWLTRKAIVALDADMLTGKAAVKAGLVDAVAGVEDVEAWALYRAEKGKQMDDEKDDKEGRASDPPPPSKPGKEPDGDEACARCGEDMPEDARFCSKCGAKAEDDPKDDKGDEDKEDKAALAHGGTVTAMLGLRPGASDAAVKAALAPLVSFRDHVVKALGASDMGSARGALKATIEDARDGVKAKRDLHAERKAASERKRVDLLLSLADANVPGFPRGDLLVDEVTEDGARTGVKAAAFYAKTPIAELEGFVKSKIANAGPTQKKGNPFTPKTPEASDIVTDEDRASAAKFGMDPEKYARSRRAISSAAQSGG